MGVLKKAKDLAMAVPFGMKAADEIFTTSNKDSGEDVSIHQQMEKKSVYDDLLRGEVTQEVEEFRYSTYRAEEEANEYSYLGNGVAKKKEGDKESVRQKRKKFTQYNYDQEYGVLESLALISDENKKRYDDWKTRKTLRASYKSGCVRFKLENSAALVKVNLMDGENRTSLYFVDDKYNRPTRPLVNFIKKTKEEYEEILESGNELRLKGYKQKNMLFSELESLWFTTIRASNDVPNGIDYKFSNGTLEGIREEDGYVILDYVWKDFDGDVLLSERFRSESAEKKYENKEKREGYVPKPEDFIVNNPTEVRERDDSNLDEWLKEVDGD